jgi:hypothetical protein
MIDWLRWPGGNAACLVLDHRARLRRARERSLHKFEIDSAFVIAATPDMRSGAMAAFAMNSSRMRTARRSGTCPYWA